jgi:hypothetical protein
VSRETEQSVPIEVLLLHEEKERVKRSTRPQLLLEIPDPTPLLDPLDSKETESFCVIIKIDS